MLIKKLWRTLHTVLPHPKTSNCSGTGAHIIQQNELIKNGTINGTEIPLVTLGIGNGLYFLMKYIELRT